MNNALQIAKRLTRHTIHDDYCKYQKPERGRRCACGLSDLLVELDALDKELNPIEDLRAFGANIWVYCDQHLRPHITGWCTVSIRNKIKLEAKSVAEAYAECQKKGYELYGPKG